MRALDALKLYCWLTSHPSHLTSHLSHLSPLSPSPPSQDDRAMRALDALKLYCWLTPWSTTSAFVNARMGAGTVDLSNPAGDPTGKGLGYAFVPHEQALRGAAARFKAGPGEGVGWGVEVGCGVIVYDVRSIDGRARRWGCGSDGSESHSHSLTHSLALITHPPTHSHTLVWSPTHSSLTHSPPLSSLHPYRSGWY